MKIKLLKDCLVGGRHCEEGEVVDVSEHDGRYLVATHAADRAGKESKAKKTTVKRTSIVMTRTCLVGGKHRDIGDKVSALEADARMLISHGHAVAADSDEAKSIIKKAKADAEAKAKADAANA